MLASKVPCRAFHELSSGALMEPTMPARTAPVTKASTLYRVGGTPMASAASSSSRMARRARPTRERSICRANSRVRISSGPKMNTYCQRSTIPNGCGIPNSPMAPPVTLRFRLMTRRISTNAMVASAR